jgi:hypothetical protein
MIDVTKLDDDGLKNLIENHLAKRVTNTPLFEDAVRERNRRNGGGLDVDRSVAYLRAAAAERRFVSYGELAEANGAIWDKVRYPMNDHLWNLICHGRCRGWPMLSAMVVNKQHLATGDMEPETLVGFTKAAALLGYQVTDPGSFLREQQAECFAWGKAGV